LGTLRGDRKCGLLVAGSRLFGEGQAQDSCLSVVLLSAYSECFRALVIRSGPVRQLAGGCSDQKPAGRPSGPGGSQLGRLRAGSDPRSSSECVLKSFENHQPFYALYDTQEIRIDSRFIDGLAGDSAGNLYDVEFSSTGWSTESRSGGTQLLDGGHVLVEPCLKPITLTRSIYAGLTCIPRIADRQPQHPLSRVVGN
jgi:hypothetical protein